VTIEDIPLPMTADLRTDLAALLATVGLDLTEQTTMYPPEAGVTRWEAVHRGHSKIVVEYWSLRMEPETWWYVQIITGGALVELREGVTLARAVDACVLAGLLPAEVREAAR
jgi:hypothetical protein